MPKILTFNFKTVHNEGRTLNLVRDGEESDWCETTVLTGRNGSYKSSILRGLAEESIAYDPKNSDASNMTISSSGESPSEGHLHVVACAGTSMDRFPPLEVGGRPTAYSVPNYVYLGQKVGGNIISKKQPLETAIIQALSPDVQGRFNHAFLREAFEFAGVRPLLEIKMRVRAKSAPSIREMISAALLSNRLGRGNDLSMSMAKYLLEEFPAETIDEYDSINQAPYRGRINLKISDRVESDINIDVVRLALLAGNAVITDANVFSRRRGNSFSAFELSSGEYQLLTNLLGLGFSIRNESIVLIDEPENSLHPQWQVDFMRSLTNLRSFMERGHMIISTHSPIILSSVDEQSTVVDMNRSGESLTRTSPLFGAAADRILLENFGVASSRNFFVVDKVQRAIQLIETEATATAEFARLIDELRTIRNAMPSDDPFVEVIAAIIYDDSQEPAR
jgi:predicted ATPase